MNEKNYQEIKKFIDKCDEKSSKRLIEALVKTKKDAINYSPEDGETILHLSCQNGLFELVDLLLRNGVDITKSSPLYAAVRGGHTEIVKRLLVHDPSMINHLTDEKWSALHTACINGRNDIVELIINFPFHRNLMQKFHINEWEFESAFNPNLLDNFGQTPLYIACLSGNDSLIEILLNWRLIGRKLDTEIAYICPVDLNQRCGFGKESALMAAVRGGFVSIVSMLLHNGMNPNVISTDVIDEIEEYESNYNTILLEAVRQRHHSMTNLLLRFGIEDTSSIALKSAVSSGDNDLICSIISKQTHEDLEYKLNDKYLLSGGNLGKTAPSTFCNSYRNLFPSHPTVINWNFTNFQLPEIKIKWILEGIRQINQQLKVNSTINEISLGAITRIDISHNSIKFLPDELFEMCSLRYLNIAQNKLESLPTIDTCKYQCPMLEELYLQDNNLEDIPNKIFRLPSIVILDISNNKLEKIPFDMWKAPKLRELNIAFNLLKDLPSARETGSAMLFKYSAADSNTMVTHRGTKNELIHTNVWSKSLEIVDREVSQTSEIGSASALRSLNLSNNLFTNIPPALPCLAENLVRLNMSYNSLRSMGHVTSYPLYLRQLDLSHNEISCWPSLATINSSDPYLACYNDERTNINTHLLEMPNTVMDNLHGKVYLNLCCHKKHLRLEYLKTLILADNLLTTIQLSTDDITTFSETEDTEWTNIGVTKTRLMYPNLSMLDISNNCLNKVPQYIHKLTNLSILNISGNVEVSELPPNMGLLSRLWNLNTKGCSLHGYLQTMIESKKFKTMEIIGYLKSIYEDARPYARMKLMVVGSQGIGKTSILDLLRDIYPNQNKKNVNDHWTKRMGATVGSNSKKKNYNISTVGVDIGDLMCDDKKKGGNSSYGQVIFRTWDFGGQREYYATHQYFLSKRSLCLVVWRIDEGKSGLIEVLQWLGNIQARAANSPVIIVGTHYDMVGRTISQKEAKSLQEYIHDRFINVTDSEKIGLPKVMSSIEISCKTNHNIRELGNLIYETAFSLRSPGCKEILLHQKVPSSYIALEDVVENISSYLKHIGSDPVLNYENFQKMVHQEMRQQNNKPFRDAAELQQATIFLHENGVLLHYNDIMLRDFYFLDPQWLCDILAQVVTIKEINPFSRYGIMKIDDINHLMKSSNGQANDRKYILSLLNKFEVALTWDLRTLLIPSMLPLIESDPDNKVALNLTSKSPKRSKPINDSEILSESKQKVFIEYPNPLSRLLLISYFPSGFWSRLMIRILADVQISETAQIIYPVMEIGEGYQLQWKLWQTGLALCCGDHLIFKLREIALDCCDSPYRQTSNKYKIKQDGIWSDIDLSRSSILEIYIPLSTLIVYNEPISVNLQNITKLLSLCVDHIDILLEDWYPTLGTRFVHTSEGRFLVTRLIPCPKCVSKSLKRSKSNMVRSREDLLLGDDISMNESVSSCGIENRKLNYTWTIEECILATYDKQILVCPIHGDISVASVAPDLLFLDLNQENVINSDAINRGNLIGRGAFGFVFKAVLNPSDAIKEPRSIAMKMLQPVQPGIRTRKSALQAYKAALEKWRRDPLQHSCKAYFTARQELSIMLNLKHPNIMPLIGVCTQPLALLLECAPKGSLDTIIQAYRHNSYRIGPFCFQQIVLQTSCAMEYLHRNHIIYRDLKAENVLVWQFPEPSVRDAPQNAVHVKIADYGISRVALPTGTKGFGGTEGFMAPEIMTHNGEEEYTEKVDCFSFGMFLYELITLRQPFEGNETVKESILEGLRPVFTTREVLFPTYCLDLMVLCWDQQPKNRPSASQIVSISCAPEFPHMVDVILLPHSDKLLAACMPHRNSGLTNATFKLWISIERCIEAISGFNYGWLTYQRNSPSQMLLTKSDQQTVTITAFCYIKSDIIWIGDSKGTIHSFSESDNSCVFSYPLNGIHATSVVDIRCTEGTNIIVAALENGRFFLLDSTCYPIKCVNTHDNFIISDFEIKCSQLFTVTLVQPNPKITEVWSGVNNGTIISFDFDNNSGIPISQQQANMQHSTNRSLTNSSVTILLSSNTFVYSYVSPGCILYQWNAKTKKILNQLDCLKLVPCSESLGSISIDKNLSIGRCQITAACLLDENVYLGTSWGCLIVADKKSLAPVIVFRPFEEEVQYITATPRESNETSPTIITIGKGYRSLINRFTDTQPMNSNHQSSNSNSNSNGIEKKCYQSHCILWTAEHWTPI